MLDIKASSGINPGNLIGQSLTRENLEAVIKFAAVKKKLFVFADEVTYNSPSLLPESVLFIGVPAR